LCGIEKEVALLPRFSEHAFAKWRLHMTRKALKAKIEEGLFPGEVLVRIRDAEDRDISFFAPKAAVHPAAGGGEVVTVRVISATGAHCLIELPGEVYGAGRIVAVPATDLTAA